MKKITAINNAVQRAITIVEAKAKKALQEPDYNVAMAVELPPLINASGIFPGVKIGGCFTHQCKLPPKSEQFCQRKLNS